MRSTHFSRCAISLVTTLTAVTALGPEAPAQPLLAPPGRPSFEPVITGVDATRFSAPSFQGLDRDGFAYGTANAFYASINFWHPDAPSTVGNLYGPSSAS